MMNKKPRIFIGSSTESLKVAEAIKANFEFDDVEVRIWNEDLFLPGQYTLDELIRFTKSFDFGIFVWANDDKVEIQSREISKNQPRDNVILEAGMFYGALGKERVFLFAPTENSPKIPSDLLGLSTLRYKTPTDKNYKAELSTGVNKIKNIILKKGIVNKELESHVETKKVVIHADPQSVHQYISEKELLNNSKTIDIILYTYETQAATLRSDLMQLSKSILFRVLIRNPYKDKLKSNNVKSSINIMNEIMSKNHLVNFQVRFYDDPPLLRTFVFHKSENQTEGLFGMYIFETESDHRFVGAENNYLLHLSNNSLFEGHLLKTIQSRFEYLWSSLSCEKAVLFDLDGVLLDSMPLYVKSWQHSFNKFGINITEKEVYLREGEKNQVTVQEIYMKCKGCEPDADTMNLLINEKEEHFIKNRGEVCVYDGVKSLLINLKERNIKLGLVTGSKNPSAKLGNDLLSIFDVVITGEDVIRGKPDPEPYLKAIEKIGVVPSNCFVIENAPLGIKSAKKANLTCFAVKNNSPLDNALLTDSGADYVYKDINHLSKHLKWADSNLELKDLIDFL